MKVSVMTGKTTSIAPLKGGNTLFFVERTTNYIPIEFNKFFKTKTYKILWLE